MSRHSSGFLGDAAPLPFRALEKRWCSYDDVVDVLDSDA
jgi:hypothetical protein